MDSYWVPLMELSRLPIIDISLLHKDPEARSLVLDQIRAACQTFGFFHIVNHGISEETMAEALGVNSKFFDLPTEEKTELMSNDVYTAVRYTRVENDKRGGNIGFARDFLKLTAYPFDEFVTQWPANPSDYREKMGKYAKEVRKVGLEVLGAIMESLGLSPSYLRDKLEQGVHLMAINNYEKPSQQINIGIAPHTDHTIITVLLQGTPGLHIIDPADGSWKLLPEIKGSIEVFVGDHLEVMSNGIYKGMLHRAMPSSEKRRLSIASLHSLPMDEPVEPAQELVDEAHPKAYKGSSLAEFLKHLASKPTKTYIETLKIQC